MIFPVAHLTWRKNHKQNLFSYCYSWDVCGVVFVWSDTWRHLVPFLKKIEPMLPWDLFEFSRMALKVLCSAMLFTCSSVSGNPKNSEIFLTSSGKFCVSRPMKWHHQWHHQELQYSTQHHYCILILDVYLNDCACVLTISRTCLSSSYITIITLGSSIRFSQARAWSK